VLAEERGPPKKRIDLKQTNVEKEMKYRTDGSIASGDLKAIAGA
jgi:hypothetical protein